MSDPVIILGLGFTTARLARRLRARNIVVYAAVRKPERFAESERIGVRLRPLSSDLFPRKAVLVHSIPPSQEPEKAALRELIREMNPRRILYISSTGVYGAQTCVDENTPAVPNDDKGLDRIDEERWLASPSVPWSTLALRSAAIYGPGRGIHMRLREGKLPRGAGGVVSRIHVDDLAAILEAGLESQIEGAWPVADELPAQSEEVSAYCCELMGIAAPAPSAPRFPVSGRNVDGRKIRELLSVGLQYPSFKSGIPASLHEESLPGGR